MLGFIGTVMAILGLIDLLGPVKDRSLPWWGDVIVIGAGAVILVVTRLLGGDDD